jgi:rSAM/selenodomain-associated transferase 1
LNPRWIVHVDPDVLHSSRLDFRLGEASIFMSFDGPTVAVGIVCKTPAPGFSKTRLSPPLDPGECAELSACFIRDLAHTIGGLDHVTPYAVYTPCGGEAALRALLPTTFRLHPQVEGSFGLRVRTAIDDLLAAGHAGAILVNSDSPTLPARILQQAVDETRTRDAAVLSPALDGGYTLIGLSKMHSRLFEDVPWSTSDVYRITLERAREAAVPVVNVPGWYDIDDEETLRLLNDELAGKALPFDHGIPGAEARHTRAFMAHRGRTSLRQIA